MRGPICVAKNENTSDAFNDHTFYLRGRYWRTLARLSTFRRWDSLIWGDITGIELNIGKLHIEVQLRSENA